MLKRFIRWIIGDEPLFKVEVVVNVKEIRVTSDCNAAVVGSVSESKAAGSVQDNGSKVISDADRLEELEGRLQKFKSADSATTASFGSEK